MDGCGTTMAKHVREGSLGHTCPAKATWTSPLCYSLEVEKPNRLPFISDGCPMTTTGGKPLPAAWRVQMRKPHVGAHTQLL